MRVLIAQIQIIPLFFDIGGGGGGRSGSEPSLKIVVKLGKKVCPFEYVGVK